MNPQTYQQALHLWPPWEESIETSRWELGYDAGWPAEEAVAWIQANYVERVRPQGEAELRRMDLPPNLFQYWEDCFYCDYRDEAGSVDFSKIRRRIAYHERSGRGFDTDRCTWQQLCAPASIPGRSSLVRG